MITCRNRFSPRAQASEIEHAARYHIRKHLQEDPVHYQQLSERLEQTLQQFGANWDQLVLALKAFVADVQAGRREDETGLDPRTQAPFFAVLREERSKEGPVSESDFRWLAALTVQLVEHIKQEIAVVGFWKNAYAQEVSIGIES